MTANGLGQMLATRSKAAGVKLTAHSFRRSVAARWLGDDGSETLLMTVAGWNDARTVRRYTKGVASDLSIAAAQRFLERERRRSA